MVPDRSREYLYVMVMRMGLLFEDIGWGRSSRWLVVNLVDPSPLCVAQARDERQIISWRVMR